MADVTICDFGCSSVDGCMGACDHFDDLDYLEDDAEDYPDCGLMPDGQCTKAGSEECDWDCGALHRRQGGGR